jgi:hypothetical protein
MERDDIVDETRQVRDEFAESHDYDVKKIARVSAQFRSERVAVNQLVVRREEQE